MSDDKCFPEGTQVKYRGAAPPESMTVIGKATPHFIELPFDGDWPDGPDLYEGCRTLEEAVEHLAELEGQVNDP